MCFVFLAVLRCDLRIQWFLELFAYFYSITGNNQSNRLLFKRLLMQQDSVRRFSYRAGNYDKFRPNYPEALIEYLHASTPIRSDHVIADIAAGTGIFTEQVAAWGNRVYAIEPNPYMRRIASQRLVALDRCILLEGTAESTGLPDDSIDIIVSAQAFHWFDLVRTKAEFRRVGRNSPRVAIVWNLRNTDTPFESAYETLIRRYAVDYLNVSQRKMNTVDVLSFFAPAVPEYRVFGHVDFLTHEQLRGRTCSYSFMPDGRSLLLPDMLASLATLFDTHQKGGKVRLSYKARLFVGAI